MTAEAAGFKTKIVEGVEVSAGKAGRQDIRLELGNWGGCCEYAAAPMKAVQDYIDRKKPFTYMVGEDNDGGTLKGIAKLVYGDRKMWMQILRPIGIICNFQMRLPTGCQSPFRPHVE